jgi:DNA-binding NarL/FixJ family response regulator
MLISVFIIDDHALVRSGVRQIVDLEADMEVVGEGAGTAEALELVRRLQPDVAVVDLEMPGIRGVDAIEVIKRGSPRCRALVCSMHASYGYVAEALRRGAEGYVLKSSPSELLIEGIRRVAQGQGYIDPALQNEVLRLLQDRDQSLFDEQLTLQELEVLQLAAEGLGNQEIAERTHQSVETVKLRLRRSFRKLGASDRASAVALALRRSLIQ